MKRKLLPITAGLALVGGSLRINICSEKSLTSCSRKTLGTTLKKCLYWSNTEVRQNSGGGY